MLMILRMLLVVALSGLVAALSADNPHLAPNKRRQKSSGVSAAADVVIVQERVRRQAAHIIEEQHEQYHQHPRRPHDHEKEDDEQQQRALATTTTNPNIPCSPLENTLWSHICFNEDHPPIIIDEKLPSLSLIQLCYTDNITDASRDSGECSSFCLLQAPFIGADGSRRCASCAWLDGQVAYDCTNLLPQDWEFSESACSSKTSTGDCARYIHWDCTQLAQSGLGFFCQTDDTPDMDNPFFPHDNVSLAEIRTSLFCANDVSGLVNAPIACEQPFCSIYPHPQSSLSSSQECADCQVHQHEQEGDGLLPIFSYDCADSFPNLTCPVLLANGTCFEETLDTKQPENTTLSNVPTFLITPRQSAMDIDDEDLDSMGFVLDLDPTTFNVLVDIYDKLVMTLFGISVAALFPAFLAWQIRQGKKVPASQLLHVPSDFLSALSGFRFWQLSTAGVTLIMLVVIGDFSHAIADAGLDFVSITQEGEPGTVMVLGSSTDKNRNPQRPFETYGDPLNRRTFVTNRNIAEGNEKASRPETALLTFYLDAVSLMARGQSPFTRRNLTSFRLVANLPYADVMDGDFRWFYVDDDEAALVSLDQELPLECYNNELAEIQRVLQGDGELDVPIDMRAFVPNCTLTNVRPTGIHGELPNPAQIVEILENNLVTEENNIRLLNGSDVFFSFDASPKSKQLTRDRGDWTQGRRFYDIDGLQVGAMNISFASVFLASGANRETFSFAIEDNVLSEYSLIAQVAEGGCPPKPSGRDSHGEEQCLVRVLLQCELFAEDTATAFHPIYAPQLETSFCSLTQFAITWGRNFEVDQELAATVAGIYGMVRPSIFEGTTRRFNEYGILAALFALGVVEERATVEEVVRPRVNVTFVVFISLPLLMGVTILALAVRAQRHPTSHGIPTEAWEILVTGAENADIVPKRSNANEQFPSTDGTLVFAAQEEQSDNDTIKTIAYRLVNASNADETPSADYSNEIEQGDASASDEDGASSAVYSDAMEQIKST